MTFAPLAGMSCHRFFPFSFRARVMIVYRDVPCRRVQTEKGADHSKRHVVNTPHHLAHCSIHSTSQTPQSSIPRHKCIRSLLLLNCIASRRASRHCLVHVHRPRGVCQWMAPSKMYHNPQKAYRLRRRPSTCCICVVLAF